MTETDRLLRRELSALLPRLRRFARSLTGHMTDADDLVQLTVERALRRAETWQPDSRVDSWAFRIMKNAWIDETRTRKVQRRIFVPDDGQDSIGEDGLAALEARMDLRLLSQAMDRLPDEQRAVVAAVMVEGLSYKEAAEVLEVPIGTVTSRLARGRMALEAMLRPAPGAQRETA